MAGSTWQQYYDPQIAARNRWAEHGHIGRADLPRRSGNPALAGRRDRRTGIRAWLAEAGAAAGAVVVSVLAVLGLHLYRAEPQSVEAPAAPVAHAAAIGAPGQAIVDPAQSGGHSPAQVRR